MTKRSTPTLDYFFDDEDGKTRYRFIFNSFKRAAIEARRHGAKCYLVTAGCYNVRTKGITINLDALLEEVCWNCGGWGRNSETHALCVDKIIEKLVRVITHEHIHKVLHEIEGREACHTFDNILERKVLKFKESEAPRYCVAIDDCKKTLFPEKNRESSLF